MGDFPAKDEETGSGFVGRNHENGEACEQMYQRLTSLTAGIANAVFIFITFALTLPGIITPMRGWLKISGWFITVCALFSLSIGVFLWVLTLKTQDQFHQIWMSSPPEVQSLMQSSVRSPAETPF